jgi:nitroimidazol reductase NimA-like FMN-containing flavoprotein (pyridoxamine 5'-phosphate oxidase superfamily)
MTTPDREIPEHGEHEDGGVDPSAEERELMEIGEEECFALLQRQHLGRLAIVRDGQPEIFPVNYALDGHTITIRTQPGVKLTYATLARVAFEVEDIDPVSREGWVVVVHGVAQDITDAIDRSSEHARATEVRPWVMGPHEHHIAIARPRVSGRRLLHRPPQHP